MENCVFCKIVKGEIPCYEVYQDERVLAFLDINPVSYGHTLIIPKRHGANIWEVAEEDLKAVISAAKKLAEVIRKAFNPSGIAFLQLNGRGVNQVVMHYHLHLIPRRDQDPPLPMVEWELRKGDPERLMALQKELKSAF